MAIFEVLTGAYLDLELNSVDSTVLYTSTRRAQAINDAQEEFCDLTECLIRQSSVTVSCNTAEYMVLSSGVLGGGSTDYSRLAKQGVEYRVLSSGASPKWRTWLAGDDFPERPIHWRSREEPGWRMSTTPADPTGYYLRADGGNLYLGLDHPPRVGSSEAAELLIPYVARPAPMVSSGTLPFTVNSSARTDLTLYHRALPHFAAYKLLPLIGDTESANGQLQKFMGYVQRFLQSMRPKGGTTVMQGRKYLRDARRGRHGWRDGYDPIVPPSQWS